ncbi:Alpha-xylosidase [Fusarium oxysporum f. sp. albedinis]|nr:Alpha-xylosidase [Fusarium oxysporum f. sp. albedinis]
MNIWSTEKSFMKRNLLQSSVSTSKTVRSRPAGTRGLMPSPDAGGEGRKRKLNAAEGSQRSAVYGEE